MKRIVDPLAALAGLVRSALALDGVNRGMKREFIIAEIKRTAAENGGSPLGRRRFAAETGINVSIRCQVN